MFERYTEKARRAIFFGRYEASQFGSPVIETEHLLLGVMREDKALIGHFLPLDFSAARVRAEVEGRTPVREKLGATIDLPLSNETKRVLAYAAEEAERLGHRHIGTEHLLLGLLREETSGAAKMLREAGVSLKQVRKELMKLPPLVSPPGDSAGARMSPLGDPWVQIELVDEQGAPIEEAPWRAGGFRLPHAGEALELARDEGVAHYRVMDVVWRVAVGEAQQRTTKAVLKLRREDA